MQKVVVASATDISVRAVNHQNPNKIGMFGFTVPTYAAILCFMWLCIALAFLHQLTNQRIQSR
jgi:hypothetical protein